jgi:hypothetical protein
MARDQHDGLIVEASLPGCTEASLTRDVVEATPSLFRREVSRMSKQQFASIVAALGLVLIWWDFAVDP